MSHEITLLNTLIDELALAICIYYHIREHNDGEKKTKASGSGWRLCIILAKQIDHVIHFPLKILVDTIITYVSNVFRYRSLFPLND